MWSAWPYVGWGAGAKETAPRCRGGPGPRQSSASPAAGTGSCLSLWREAQQEEAGVSVLGLGCFPEASVQHGLPTHSWEWRGWKGSPSRERQPPRSGRAGMGLCCHPGRVCTCSALHRVQLTPPWALPCPWEMQVTGPGPPSLPTPGRQQFLQAARGWAGVHGGRCPKTGHLRRGGQRRVRWREAGSLWRTRCPCATSWSRSVTTGQEGPAAGNSGRPRTGAGGQDTGDMGEGSLQAGRPARGAVAWRSPKRSLKTVHNRRARCVKRPVAPQCARGRQDVTAAHPVRPAGSQCHCNGTLTLGH